MLKYSRDSLRCKYELKQVTKTRETNESRVLRKMGLKFENPSFNILCKIKTWKKKKCLNKKMQKKNMQRVALVKRQPVDGTGLKNVKFY